MKNRLLYFIFSIFMSLLFLFSCADSEMGNVGLASESVGNSGESEGTAEPSTHTTSNDPAQTPAQTETPAEIVTTAKVKEKVPTIRITTVGSAPITSKEDYIKATVSLEDSGQDFENYSAKIRGRGNSTWLYFDKKPYRLKFNTAVDLFGMGESKDYVLLSNAMDMSMLNNYAAFTLGDIFGMEYNCQCEFVNVFINGTYEGLYLLTEQIEVGKNRVDIGGKNSTEVDTSYLVEFGGGVSSDEVYKFNVGAVVVGNKVYQWRDYFFGAVKSPDVVSKAQLNFISNYVNEVNDAIYRKDFERFCQLCDLDSFVSNVLVNEISLASDFDYCFYMYKKAGGKLYLGPIWDFDQGFGISTKNGNTFEGLTVSKYTCWVTALLEMPEFYEAAREKWIEHYDEIHSLPDHLMDKSAEIRKDINRNFLRHDVLGKPYWRQTPEMAEFVTYNEFRNRLVYWLEDRIAWLDGYFKAED